MEKRRVGKSDLKVSVLSLGSMTFGGETEKVDAEAQLDLAYDAGVNLIDTAEIYPAPVKANTFGNSELIIGDWLKKRKIRNRVIISTKAAGPGDFIKWVRRGRSSHSKKNLFEAVEGSLRRLSTDYIDLFHLHWPDRAIDVSKPFFRPPLKELDYSFETTMEALNKLTTEGKIRYVGLCNESPWGVKKLLEYEKAFPNTKIISLQNPYNLLNRKFEVNLAEVAHHEKLSLLAYSPLAMGLLTDRPSDSLETIRRRTKRNIGFKTYCSLPSIRQRNLLTELAKNQRIGLSLMSLGFVLSRPFTASAIVGSTSVEQLQENLTKRPPKTTKSLEKKINNLYEENKNPCL
ncbi:MAG: aldo/keto reductase [Pseudomonadota bacterium]|nr:aldo/keto reductase [Pseudomonadota bacterium]